MESQPSIDVEVAVRDGSLDVGLFAPKPLLDESQVEDMLHELQSLLRQTVQ